ncbi:MAG: cysteine desulfurase [Bacteroidetes bacterium]|nr:cysteine desulfurase [Bacteroidota bacterium]
MSARIYLDNAATTPIDPLVVETMLPYLQQHFGNPSSIYSYGRETRMAIEQARKTVAGILHAQPAEIFFTSGGTESSNTIFMSAVRDLGCKRIITSPLEHHATLHTVEFLQQRGEVEMALVEVLPNGHICLDSLASLLAASDKKTIVSLMHANNEIGNITDLHAVGKLCKAHHALFHSDTVQTVGHFAFDLKDTPVDFITGAAHKFHGPKGAGLLYINQQVQIKPYIHGGGQERNMRAGTENVAAIVGFAKALEMATENMEKEAAYVGGLKQYMIDQLRKHLPAVDFNGDPEGRSNYTVLNVAFPKTEKAEMLLFNLDMHHICASGGSACSSGANIGSHVIRAIGKNIDKVPVRFSFSKYNTREEIDAVVAQLQHLI